MFKQLTRKLTLAVMAVGLLSGAAMAAGMPTNLYIKGHINGSEWNRQVPYSYKTENSFVFNVNLTGWVDNGEHSKVSTFFFIDGNNTEYTTSNTNTTENKPEGMQSSDYSWQLNNGNYSLTLDFSGNKPELKVGTEPVITEIPSKLYIIGHVNNSEWNQAIEGTSLGNNKFKFDVNMTSWTDGLYSTFAFVSSQTPDVEKEKYGVKGIWFYGSVSDGSGDQDVQSGKTLNPVWSSNGSGWKISNGKHTLVVDMSNPQAPSIEVDPTDVPENPNTPTEKPTDLYIMGNVTNGSWDNPVKYTSKTENTYIFLIDIQDGWGQGVGSFGFTTDITKGQDTENYIGASGTTDTEVIFNGDYGTCNNVAQGVHCGWTATAGHYEIKVDFTDGTVPVITLHRLGDAAKTYYFIGDMNDWFSTEFENPQFVEGGNNKIYVQKYYDDADHTEYYEICKPENGATHSLSNQGINREKCDKEKGRWAFEYIDDTQNDWFGWYRFDNFPGGKLTGQFQIFDGTDWEGEVYSHAQGIINDGNVNPWFNQYEKYYTHPITREHIANAITLTKAETEQISGIKEDDSNYVNAFLLKDNQPNAMIRKHNDQNFHMECNAVTDAVIYFKPGDEPQLVVSGTPVDYYIFYNMEKAENGDKKENGEDWVRAITLEGKPNTNNYFLPGIWYTQINKDDGSRSPLPNYPEGDEHMNHGGIDLIKIDFNQDFDNLKKQLEEIFFSQYDNGKEIVCGILGCDVDEYYNVTARNSETSKLPDGRSLAKYSEIWVTKIPSGFEDPAGRKYTMMFDKARHSQDSRAVHTITPSHMYFFSINPLHVHVDYSAVKDFFNEKRESVVDVYYRVYTQDRYFNTVVVNIDDNTPEYKRIYTRNESPKQTIRETGDKRNYGWVKLTDQLECSNWDPDEIYCNDHEKSEAGTGHTWNVRWIKDENTSGSAPRRAINEAGVEDLRHRVHTNFSQAYVQLRVEAKDGTGSLENGKLAYFPEKMVFDDDYDYYRFNGKDFYAVMRAGDPNFTGIDDIVIERVDEDGEPIVGKPVYYNLQGRKVANPSGGIFIKVTGNRSEKIYIK